MNFRFKDNEHCSSKPIDIKLFKEFLLDNDDIFDFHEAKILIGGSGSQELNETPLVSENTAKAFYDWLTKVERSKGFLSGKQFYRLRLDVEHEKVEVKYGKDVFEKRFPLFASVQSPATFILALAVNYLLTSCTTTTSENLTHKTTHNYQTNSKIIVSTSEAKSIGKKIWYNECGVVRSSRLFLLLRTFLCISLHRVTQ